MGANFSNLPTTVSNLYDVIYIQKTILPNKVSDDDLKTWVSEPTSLRSRPNSGDINIYLSNNICAKRRPDLESSDETMWVEIKIERLVLQLCNCYRLPFVGIEFWNNFSVTTRPSQRPNNQEHFDIRRFWRHRQNRCWALFCTIFAPELGSCICRPIDTHYCCVVYFCSTPA